MPNYFIIFQYAVAAQHFFQRFSTNYGFYITLVFTWVSDVLLEDIGLPLN